MGWTVEEKALPARTKLPWETGKQKTYKAAKHQRGKKKGYPGFSLGNCNIIIEQTTAAAKADPATQLEELKYLGIINNI